MANSVDRHVKISVSYEDEGKIQTCLDTLDKAHILKVKGNSFTMRVPISSLDSLHRRRISYDLRPMTPEKLELPFQIPTQTCHYIGIFNLATFKQDHLDRLCESYREVNNRLYSGEVKTMVMSIAPDKVFDVYNLKSLEQIQLRQDACNFEERGLIIEALKSGVAYVGIHHITCYHQQIFYMLFRKEGISIRDQGASGFELEVSAKEGLAVLDMLAKTGWAWEIYKSEADLCDARTYVCE